MELNKTPLSVTVPHVLKKFADLLNTEMIGNKVIIPEKFGKGYCAGYILNENIRLLLLDYELKEELILEDPDSDSVGKMLLFKFQGIFPKTEKISAEKPSVLPTALIATRRAGSHIPVHTNTATINIEVSAGYLDGLLNLSGKSTVLQQLLQNTQPLLFEQLIQPALQKIVDEILMSTTFGTFELYFLRIKTEELICRLLMELEKREENQLYALNGNDIRILYTIREQILEHLDIPPVINELSAEANMSPTKLKRLFKQVFGNSIFNYYQEFRMKEAARLLKDEKLSVSEVGYQLGFTNLSHFTRLFEKHIGLKPKKYSMFE
ncbi:helix-turn-helix domain-containing protein [Flavobacterium microcysteis]|uniref:Helix-turn-helix transcriptional regulator n=1 Tax=Flavobacterium microcysteis TaxID=2596891 RepID=A0A501PZ38_9FLAO|nr:AraC family transcriptional regulator [Flavobacterium microcysteis]TPD65829.1 helix-turn-helix transcriptional regulator [Flavobacterium microcysteis]